jgi:hypothetical protein
MDTYKVPTQKILATRIGFSFLSIAFIFLVFVANSNAQATAGMAVASFTGLDNVSQGNWHGKYGADGYSIPNIPPNIPSYAVLAVQNQSNWTWNNSTTDPRALQTGSGSGRIASTWFTYSTMTFDVNLTDGNSHQIALYALDWDGGSRTETVQVVDANSGLLLDARSISNFTNGMYLVWSITGHAKISVTYTGGSNAVMSGVFFGGALVATAPTAPTTTGAATANLVSIDTATEGNWQGKYGADGHSIASSTQTIPAYASFIPQNQVDWTWTASTTDPRALESSSSGRMATAWYNTPTFNYDLNLTDGNSHQIALYALDWDFDSRSETIQIADANSGAVLDTRNLSSFSSGTYFVWNISGHVKINVTLTGGPNAVISGVFFGGASSNATAPSQPPPATNGGTLILNASSTSLSFGQVNVSSSTNQTITLTNAGSATVTISNVSVAGAGFNASGVSTGTILAPGQSASLNATFAPEASGNASGSITIASNATHGSNVIALSGTAVAPVPQTVALSWSPSTSAVVGYNVYVSLVSGSGYTKLTSSPVPTTDYSDTGLQTAQTRYYVVTSVNSGNEESGYSTQVAAIVP